MARLIISLVLGLLIASPTGAETTAFVNVNVLPMTTEKVVFGQTVLVTDGVIASIGDVDRVAVPDGSTVVDGTDRFLMPGLTEMHAHITSSEPADVNRLFSLFLAGGVTTVRGMLGRPAHLALRDDIAAGRVIGPWLITSGPSLNGDSVSGPLDGARQVRKQHAAGYDFIKIHPGLSAPEFNAIADTANELNIPFAGHVPVSVGIAGALEKRMATIDHLDGYMVAMLPANADTSGGYGGFFDVMLASQVNQERIADVVSATAASGVANVPTEVLFEQLVSEVAASDLAARPEMRRVPSRTLERWVRAKDQIVGERGFDPRVAATAISIRRQLILGLHRAGAPLLLGSDAPQAFNVPGVSIHHELALMVAAGLTPYEALRTGTIAPAQFFRRNAGAIEVGRIGDLVLLDANPLEDIDSSRRVHGVLVGGRWLRSADLLAQLGN